METVPDTDYIKALPEFKAETGIDVDIEAIGYIDMHSKRAVATSPASGYEAIVVDFYWVASSPRPAGDAVDDLIARDRSTPPLRAER